MSECLWPGCADPVCERDCPLKDDYIVECSGCGASIGASTLRCPHCDVPAAAVSEGSE